jgi:hypothetical protein
MRKARANATPIAIGTKKKAAMTIKTGRLRNNMAAPVTSANRVPIIILR